MSDIEKLLSYGVVREDRHDVYKEIRALCGPAASESNLVRQRTLIHLLDKLDRVRQISSTISVDRYLELLDNIEVELKGI